MDTSESDCLHASLGYRIILSEGKNKFQFGRIKCLPVLCDFRSVTENDIKVLKPSSRLFILHQEVIVTKLDFPIVFYKHANTEGNIKHRNYRDAPELWHLSASIAPPAPESVPTFAKPEIKRQKPPPSKVDIRMAASELLLRVAAKRIARPEVVGLVGKSSETNVDNNASFYVNKCESSTIKVTGKVSFNFFLFQTIAYLN
jgi:hypothetical protein